MTAQLDANVLIALLVTDHVHHEVAEDWLADWTGPVATCPTTQGALVRFLLRRGATAGTAVEVLGALEASAQHEFWSDDQPYVSVNLAGVIGHRQVTDAYLAALARARGARLATLDRGLAALQADVALLLDASDAEPAG